MSRISPTLLLSSIKEDYSTATALSTAQKAETVFPPCVHCPDKCIPFLNYYNATCVHMCSSETYGNLLRKLSLPYLVYSNLILLTNDSKNRLSMPSFPHYEYAGSPDVCSSVSSMNSQLLHRSDRRDKSSLILSLR